MVRGPRGGGTRGGGGGGGGGGALLAGLAAALLCGPVALAGRGAGLGEREKVLVGWSEAHHSQSVVLTLSHGAEVEVRLRLDISPKVAQAVLTAARGWGCGHKLKEARGCRFYRSEKKPLPGAVDNFGGPGPPYALLQGTLPLKETFPKEGAPSVKRGMACLIGEGPDFFFAVGDHPEWGDAHTVWGEVVDMSVVDEVVQVYPVREETWGETRVTALEHPIPFILKEKVD